ncbi:MAG: HAMP domain-containing sensor histidine kinase [Pseudomonadota bacterium]
MRLFDSLKRRIMVAYTLYAFGFVLFFALIATFAVEGIEEHLIDNRLRKVAVWASPRQAGGLPVEMPAGVSFHHGDDIPLSLRGLRPGVQDMHVDGVGLHVLAGSDARGDYVVVDHESDYEKVEWTVYSMFGAGFLGFMLFSYFLGHYVARGVVTPIGALAAAVRDGVSDLPLLDSRDELGVLARTFAAHTRQLHIVLERERFFTGDVSHELRSPLTVIMGAAEVLMAHGEASPSYAPAARIYRAAQEAAECVAVLLLLARAPELGQLPAIDIGKIASREVERHQHLVAHKPVQLSFSGGVGFPVHAPRELCAAAIGNLVRNACQYTEQGTVTVHLAWRSVTVEDSGPGLPEAVRAALAGQGIAPAGGSAGTGLGLALVKRICAYLGASLTLTDRHGGGSTFVIRFPD